MINKDCFKDKKITVAGLARSGFACAKLLSDLGADVSVTDNQDNDSTRSYALQLKSRKIRIETGRHSRDFVKGSDLLVVSPGIPEDSLPLAWAEEFHIPVISEIELAWTLCPATIIAVTGSNGKTTVTTLIGRVLEAAGKKTFVCGNIGNPFSGEVEKMGSGDYVSLEVSSFQLEKIRDFKPRVSVILNLAVNHLDRYRDLGEYINAKRRIFMNQDKSDYLVLNCDDPLVKGLEKEAKANTVFFSGAQGLNPNQAAVLAVASILGIKKEICLEVFKAFKGIEHRLEYVTEINNITFINDSKSTTADSTLWALRNLSRPVVLIAGGRHKGIDYAIASDLIREKARAVILIGEAKDKIREALKGFTHLAEASTLEEAVKLAFSSAKAGDCVLFSPMCSSYDMFLNYEARGRAFKEAVFGLAESKYGA